MTTSLSQRARLGLLALDVSVLLICSRIGFGSIVPANDDRGIWFFTALLGLLLGSRLDTPFFVTPADVLLYAAPAAVALLLSNSWPTWSQEIRAMFSVALGFCGLCIALGTFAILTHSARSEQWQRRSNAARILAESLGTPKAIYSVVVAFALFAFHRDSTREFTTVTVAWVLTGVLSPVEGLISLARRLRRAFNKGAVVGQDGEVVAFQTPGLLLIRQTRDTAIRQGSVVAIRDVVGSARMALVLDQVGRDDGILVRAMEQVPTPEQRGLVESAVGLAPNGVVCLPTGALAHDTLEAAQTSRQLVGLVAPETSIERLYFQVVADDELEEGRLVEVRIRTAPVLYQVVNGLTKEEIVRQRNTHGYARAQAQKVGTWHEGERRFLLAKWLPRPNAAVYLHSTTKAAVSPDAIGHLPGTDYEVRLKSVSHLVTHNTAILGILGVGKSSLAFELVERMIAERIKVVCVDVTGEYATALAPFLQDGDQRRAEEVLHAATANGKTNCQQNVEEGGSRAVFADKLREVMSTFLGSQDDASRLLIVNPAKFEVWRQDSRIFNNKASMASLSSAEITQLVADAALDTVASLGPADSARLCVVLEEAHSLVPEWNSTIADGDRSASNGTARAILQGRKYGMGCLLITQRTANVTKTILNQCNTIFAMRTFDDTGKGFLANYVGSEYADALPSLSERQAVLFGRASSCENPVLIRLNDRSDFIQAFRRASGPQGATSPATPAADTPA